MANYIMSSHGKLVRTFWVSPFLPLDSYSKLTKALNAQGFIYFHRAQQLTHLLLSELQIRPSFQRLIRDTHGAFCQ